MNNIETMKQWLEELNDLAAWNDGEVGGHMDEPYAAEVARRIIKSLSQVIEQAQQAEPVIDKSAAIRIATALGWTPPRQWVGLTPQERDEINEQVYGAVPHHVAFHAAIEAKLKQKNT